MEGDQPRVRPFGTIDLFDGKLTIQTGKVKDVSRQILQNYTYIYCAFDGSCWLRVAATAVEDDRLQAQEHMLAAYPSLQKMYKPGDGNTQIFALEHGTATFSSFTDAPRTLTF